MQRTQEWGTLCRGGVWKIKGGPPAPIHLRRNLPAVLEDAEQNLSPRLRWLLHRMWQEWRQIETDIEGITVEMERISQEDARRVAHPTVPFLIAQITTA